MAVNDLGSGKKWVANAVFEPKLPVVDQPLEKIRTLLVVVELLRWIGV
ncbi:hypothetical protein RMSM_06437 [Rhodopirellula maiorica SM1]|uniref:Uncharacterized protein n=1 Tax=Rhodopirellula maiorica SM1 TaxID=1265738 RepID=M5RRP7_9BACT|nr:hypothetical protein RMSM_06437 [Rhodopirellula maiorica SM1]